MSFGIGTLNLSNPDIRTIRSALLLLFRGKTNNTGSFTCDTGAASTVVSDEKCSPSSTIYYTPTTANASAEVGAGTIYISAKADGSFTVTHVNSATTGRTFDYIIVG